MGLIFTAGVGVLGSFGAFVVSTIKGEIQRVEAAQNSTALIVRTMEVANAKRDEEMKNMNTKLDETNQKLDQLLKFVGIPQKVNTTIKQ